jgi:hypothetical protein
VNPIKEKEERKLQRQVNDISVAGQLFFAKAAAVVQLIPSNFDPTIPRTDRTLCLPQRPHY